MFYLESTRLILRDYRLEDWERLHIYGQDPEFSKYEPWGPNTEEDSKNFAARMVESTKHSPRYRMELAVELKDNGLMIGGCSIRRESEESSVGSLGWAINPEFQNRGIATEAARTLIEFGLGTLQLKVIYALCDTRNGASYRVMEKLGMKRVGLIPGEKSVKGYMRDLYRYELVR